MDHEITNELKEYVYNNSTEAKVEDSHQNKNKKKNDLNRINNNSDEEANSLMICAHKL